MADFCKQCSEELFGNDFGDLKNLGEGAELKPGMGWLALCEGCGVIVVDNEGKCSAEDCSKHSEKKLQ